MRRGAIVFGVTVGLLLAGGALLRGFADGHDSDPAASLRNGAPRGLLALGLLLEKNGRAPSLLVSFEDAPPSAPAAVVVPPPERTNWNDEDAAALLDQVRAGSHAFILCDDEAQRTTRLERLLLAVGVECFRAEVPIGDTAPTEGAGAFNAYPQTLHVRGTGRVRVKDNTAAFAAWSVGSDGVVVRRVLGEGTVTVLGSATIVSNDGLALADNAAFALASVPKGPITFDERHHGSRSRAALLAAAGRSAGPLTSLLLLLLLVPLSLLSLWPRPGDAPANDEHIAGAPAAVAQAQALAALLARAKR